MLICDRNALKAIDFDKPWLCVEDKVDTCQHLAIIRDGVPQPLAARYVSGRANIGWTTPNVIQEMFVINVSGAPRKPFDFFIDERHGRRPSTDAGALGILDFRNHCYADLRGHSLNSTMIFVPISVMNDLADELHVPRIDQINNLSSVNCVDSVMCHIAQVLEPALARPEEANAYFLEHIFAAVCVHIGHSYGDLQRPRTPDRVTLSPHQVRRVQDWLRVEIKAPPTLQELAASCSLSVSHFTRAFRENTGLPPHRWLLAERVRQAQDMLYQSEMPISHIALDCGFADQSHLTRVFSRHIGVSPAAWRRQKNA
ncbi:helix-turn-helix transcriptional regulator [Gluconacetobacter azotocaptans]|jgi:AraC family transcriptional regulator|uniref:AraC family transcriptional regulator n=1 Tax=Gluconacetobacter azotocaptans TaxID=142834 RepID=UPI0019560217|nr:AraC family transcriptional regulator [Gluconacetobacter azotocaptans]MBM9401128.1 helix-turn-helix transcriptional regulator [Gluconacetobacter azotocaptans]